MRSVRRKDDELQLLSKELVTFLVAMRLGVTPVPIPNTMVKTQAADGTALETVWESRWLPELQKNILPLDTSIYLDGGVAQLGEHLPCKQGVKGSNPFISTQQANACWFVP